MISNHAHKIRQTRLPFFYFPSLSLRFSKMDFHASLWASRGQNMPWGNWKDLENRLTLPHRADILIAQSGTRHEQTGKKGIRLKSGTGPPL